MASRKIVPVLAHLACIGAPVLVLHMFYTFFMELRKMHLVRQGFAKFNMLISYGGGSKAKKSLSFICEIVTVPL